MESKAIIPIERIEKNILLIRGKKVMIDTDLAELMGFQPNGLMNKLEGIRKRFPKDFMFPLTKKEKAEVVAKCDHLSKLKFSSSLPYAFTEHGAVMLASVLNSPKAIEASLLVVRAFVRLREIFSTHEELATKT
ncbi:MAG: ORF6N domain-containing protein [Ignavibacteriales bacterium]|nr:ORF6N domain-containing protein [Ignavibacteriales bacterium]